MRVAILGAGSGGAAAVAELGAAGHSVVLWARSEATLAPFRDAGGVRYAGVLGEGLAEPALITSDLRAAIAGADAAVVALPTFAHASVATALAEAGWPADRPVILNPGHTGGALEFAAATEAAGAPVPPLAEFSTLSYVARQYAPGEVTITGRAKALKVAALPGGDAALAAAATLFPAAQPVADVLASDLSNVNMVLHPPGAVMAAAWVEATGGAFTFYVEALTPGVARVIKALDEERRAVAAAFGHTLPTLIEEMQAIGTVEPTADPDDYAGAISGGEANKRIKGPDSLAHRYYREDFGHGLLPFVEMAAIAGVAVPVAASLLAIAEAATGTDYRADGRTAARMGIAGLDRNGLIARVRA
jgi:opine dehydrogenase